MTALVVFVATCGRDGAVGQPDSDLGRNDSRHLADLAEHEVMGATIDRRLLVISQAHRTARSLQYSLGENVTVGWIAQAIVGHVLRGLVRLDDRLLQRRARPH